MQLSVPAVLRRIEATSQEHGVAYPWWMPVLCKSGQLGAAAMAFLQRDAFATWQFLAVLFLLLAPIAYELGSATWLPSWVRLLPNAGVLAVILTLPIGANTAFDATVVVLALMVADFQARDGSGVGVFTGGMMPGVMATIALRSPAARRGWVFGLTATATSLGNAAGPALGALAAGAFGLRASFLLTGAVMTGAGLWVALTLGRGGRSARGPTHVQTPQSGQSDLQAAG